MNLHICNPTSPVQYLCCVFVDLQCAVKVFRVDYKYHVLNSLEQSYFKILFQLVATTLYKPHVTFIL